MRKGSIILSLALVVALIIGGCGDDPSQEFIDAQDEIASETQDEIASETEEKQKEVSPTTMRDPRSDIVIEEGTLDELFNKYGPKDMSQEEIDSLVESIEWTSNDEISILGSSEAKRGGNFTYGMTSYPATLRTEGENSSYVFNSQLENLVYQGMTTLDPITMETIPVLANKWNIADDQKTFFFHIDPEAHWRDGQKVRSFDYVASWDLFTADDLRDPFTQDYWHKFERPVALTEDIVMVKAKGVEWRLFMAASGMTVYPEHEIGRITAEDYMDDYNNKMPVGTGPYYFDEAETNQYIKLIRNDNFWAEDKERYQGMYNFDKIRFVFYTEDSILLEKFKAGDIDFQHIGMARRWAEEYTADNWEQIDKNHVIKQRVYNHAPNGMSGIILNMRKWPFDDKKVRKAFSYLRNRQKLMETIFYNEYAYMDSYFPNSPYENPDNEKIRHDPIYAEELLEEAGYEIGPSGFLEKDGRVLELTMNYSDDNRVETVLQEDMEYLGIKLNLRQVDWARHIRDLNERNFRLISIAYSGLLFPNPEGQFHSRFADKDNTNNVWGFKNDRVDEITEAYNLEFNVEKRIQMLREMDSILMDEYMTMLAWYSDNIRLLYWNKFNMPEFVIDRFTSASNAHTSAISYWWYDEDKADKLDEVVDSGEKLPGQPDSVNYWEPYQRDY
ncbi:MAG: ABC transporter substrate-binding protein [Candidatus Muiribacteriota bacterium]